MTWVLLDYGRVICEPPSQQDEAAIAEAANAPRLELWEQYWKWRLSYDLADLDARQYWRAIAGGLGRSFSSTTIAELVRLDCRSWLRLQAGTVALIEELAAAGQQLALLSNAPAEVAAAIRGLPLAGRFRQLFFSCDLGTAKPDPACYLDCLGRLGARPEEVIFLDDRPENVTAAAGLGVRAVQFAGPAQARAEVLALLAAGA